MIRFVPQRFGVRALVAIAFLGLAAFASAGEYFETEGLALRGYDPVSYFTAGKPERGLPQHSHVHEGSKFLFASAENRALFVANPDKYAPQFGGYCAFGTARGYKVSTSPDAFSVVDGKLYLNYNSEVVKIWKQDVPGNIALAEKNWPEVRKTEPKD